MRQRPNWLLVSEVRGEEVLALCVLEDKPADSEAAKVKAIYSVSHSVVDVLTYSGEYNKDKYKGLDKELLTRIQNKFDALKKEIQTPDA